MLIQITVKQVYGKASYYPANKLAHSLAKLLKQKTFTSDNLSTLQAEGFTLECSSVAVEDKTFQVVRG